MNELVMGNIEAAARGLNHYMSITDDRVKELRSEVLTPRPLLLFRATAPTTLTVACLP